ncbi:MAG: fibronectin type III domain-containing protein, partial [Propionibacteriaceae bacterium]
MSRTRTRWFVPVFASMAVIVSQSVMAGLIATRVYAAPMMPGAVPISATDSTLIPHYFGPYPNWANSPQTLSNAIVTLGSVPASPVAVGNALVARAAATDIATAAGTLAPVFVVVPSAKLPAGVVSAFNLFNQTGATVSAGNLFHAYILRPDLVVANKYTVVYDSGVLTVPVPTNSLGETTTYAVSPAVTVQANDVIGFYGGGVPFDTGAATNFDSYSSPASADASLVTNVAPAVGAVMTLGVDANYPLPALQGRIYSFAATATPTAPGTGADAVATVDPKTGGIASIAVTVPGSNYVAPPVVTITSPGVTPTALAAAHSVISAGVVTGIVVAEAGFGFTAPVVTITGGGTPSTPATAVASGEVDDLQITSGGSGYLIEPIVKFGLPDAAYCLNPGVICARPTATATMTSGVVTGIQLLTRGSGYSHPPVVDIWDGPALNLATPAIVKATVNVGRIDITNGGAGYDSVPTVTITDSVAPLDKGATAVATVAVLGAVTSIIVDLPGAGYLTPGLKKFVDTLPGLGAGKVNDLGQYIPIGVPDKTTYPGTDYYEIGVVQYRMKFHRDLPATLLRGYVQLSTPVVPGNREPLSNAILNSAAVTPILGVTGVDKPHYLGPTIVAEKDRAVRIKFRNLLPTGEKGDLFLPVDTSMMGSGMGPDMITLNADGTPQDMTMDTKTVLDEVRNPLCSRTPKPATCFSENRATLHLHGGITPWISDGTPHQWITPAGEGTAYPKGVSVSNVPDMPDPGDGSQTFFYTNQQSARLMFYHDHSWGITRLNVYAGEAAGYLITDSVEQSLISPTGALAGLGLGEPLIVQDKTFVPDAATMAKVDPTWQAAKWGGAGSLWTPHVYMPAQNPGDPSGMSSFGRWMYGPWFWPPNTTAKYQPIPNPYYVASCDPNVQPFCEPAMIPGTPNVSVGMEAFNDTPIVNGTAYPTTTVDPKTYRYRVLNAANDRFWNLSWYVADPTTGTLSEVALNKSEVALAQGDPVVFPTPDETLSPKGPNWIQIGSEGGFLPTPVVVPAQPTTWITDPTRFDVGNVDLHSLLLAPAERADVLVDFSAYRGKTLILYNDAPAAFPARVPGYDYYTGGPDLSPAGAPSTLPGYGPNTRTVMQVKVSNAAPAVAFDRPNTTNDRLGALMTAFAHHADGSGVFEAGQHPVIVGQAAYNTAYNTNFVANGYCNTLTNPSARCDGYARINEQGGDTFKFDTLSGNQIGIPLQPKGVHDEMNSATFDEFGRMTANMGLEAPGITPLTQNIILYPYVNPATETLNSTSDTLPSSFNVTPISTADDGTQIWKITHNGVDTHPLHFHLYDVQVINRVTWDNIIIPPEPTELGWKETVRVSPLEDTLVAVRPILPTLPFSVPDSWRPLNPMMPIGARGTVAGPNGSEAGFNNTDVLGNPIAPIVNARVNFNWEYVWHCHILSHEEMDMMRPVTVKVVNTLPLAPVLTPAPGAVLNWTDATPVDMTNPLSWTLTGAAKGTAEVGYKIQRADTINGTYSDIGTALANASAFTVPAAAGTGYYRVVAWNAAGETASNSVQVSSFAPDAPTNLAGTSGTAGGSLNLSWTAPANDGGSPITGYEIQKSPATGAPVWTAAATVGNVTSTTVTGLTWNANYIFQVRAVNAAGPSAWSAASASVHATGVPGAPTGVVGSNATSTSIDLSWTPPVDNGGLAIDRYLVYASTDGGVTWSLSSFTTATLPLPTTWTWTGLTPGTSYRFVMFAHNSAGWSVGSP